MDTLGLSIQYKVRHCSQCQGDTEFYCNSCKHDLCLQCKEKHVIDLDTVYHDVVIYREKFEYLPKQEPALLYDAGKQQVGNEQLKLMSTPVLHASVCVKGVGSVRHISRVMSDRVWVSHICNIILTDTTGGTIHRVKGIAPLYGGGLHTVNSSGELIYIDSEYNINKLSIDNETVTKLLQRPSPWFLYCVYCSLSTEDLMVGMCNYKTGKVTRYNSSGQHILTIEHDNTGHMLYSEPYCITENKNGDIIVSDWITLYCGAVVVTNRGGRHRFSYTGPPSGSSLDPRGICTDALSHILVCDLNTRTVQMIDKDGHFLSILLIQKHGINEPYSLNYDDKTHFLWVGSYRTNTVSVYRYLQRRYSLTDNPVDDDKMIFKSTDGTNIWEGTSEKTELELMLSRTGKEKKDKIPVSAEIIPDDLSLFTKPTSTAPEKRPLLSHYLLKILDYPSPFTRIGPLEKRHAISVEHRGLHRNKPHSHSFTPDRVRSTDSGISISEHTVSVDMKESEEEAKPDVLVYDGERIIKSTYDTDIWEDTSKTYDITRKPKIYTSGDAFSTEHSVMSSSEYKVSADTEESEEEAVFGKTKEDVLNMSETLMTKRRKQPKENGEADIGKSLSVNSLYIDIKYRKLRRSQIINNAYGDIISSLDYLDCIGLNLMYKVSQGTTINPFLQSIEPFSKCSVQDFLEWMEDCKQVLRKTRSTTWGHVSSTLFAVYTKEAILGFKEKDLVEIIDHSIRCAIESENCILVSELVRTYCIDLDIQLQRNFEDIKNITTAIIDTILQTVRHLILRKLPTLQNNAILLSFCVECGQENNLVMIMSYKGNIEMKDRLPDQVMGLKLVLYNFTHLSDEASSVFNSIPVSNKTPLPTVTESEARELFRKHSNLTMISASPYKSIGYSKGRHRVVETLCISLFCFHKGYIPYGEEIFPKQLGGIEVDVQDGYCYFGAGRSLELGGHLKRLVNGSIGGFVDLPNSKVGLITCAHVVFSPEELMNRQFKGIKVEAFDKRCHSYNVCGESIDGIFPQCVQIEQFNLESASKDPNVDAALIELDQDIDTFEFRAVTSEQLQSAGFDPSNPPLFSGEVVSLPGPDPDFDDDCMDIDNELPNPNPVRKISRKISNKLDSVVKYGAVTGLTIGNLYHSPVHVRFVQEKLALPGKFCCAVMCDQIEIQNLPQGQFFVCGDSGSFVFCINPDKTLSCLGMAIGLSTRESCLVTPIDRILRSVSPPGARLKPCSSLIQQTRTNTPPQATLDMILAAIQNLQTEVRTLQSQVQQIEDSKIQSSSNQSSVNQN